MYGAAVRGRSRRLAVRRWAAEQEIDVAFADDTLSKRELRRA